MTKMRKPNSWVALLVAILFLFAACKGETPTAPPAGGNNGGGGTPPIDATLTLTASSISPRTNGTVIITATVTQNGQPVPNGTAVQFVATDGEFTDTGTQSTVRTTTNGVTTASLTSDAAGTIRVTATVNNVVRTIDITFSDEPACVPPDPRCPVVNTPTITSVSPGIGRPAGGETITITGTNFRAPVRVLFDLGTRTVEAFVATVTPTQITVVSPSVDLGTGQELVADIIVLTEAGTTTEQRVEKTGAFTFRSTSLQPVIYSLTPASGPINGGTRVTIVGEGFQAPVQVFFGSAEAKVIETNFSQIIVQAPDGRSTNPDGSGTVVGPVAVEVVNINSNKRGTSPTQFRYLAKVQITAVSPRTGPATGGTDVTIDGIGFDNPVDVIIGGIPAQVIRVSGTQILARTQPAPIACAPGGGSVVVTNVENGDFDTYGSGANEQSFTYIGVNPLITGVTDELIPTGIIIPGENITVVVDDPGTGPLGFGNIRFQILGRTVIPSPAQVTDASAPRAFTFPVPTTGISFPTVACAIGTTPGVRFGPTDVELTFLNETTGCTDSFTITVTPPDPNPCLVPPQATVVPTAPNCAVVPGTVAVADPATGTVDISFTNTAPAGAQDLNIRLIAITGIDATNFGVAPQTRTAVAGGVAQTFTVTFNPSFVGTATATATFTTNDPNNPTINVCLTGNGS